MKGSALSPKRAITVLLSAAVITAGAGSLSVGSAATGAPSPSNNGAAKTPAQATRLGPAQPKTTLSLPTTIHLIDHNTSTRTVGGGHLVITALLKHKSGSVAGGAVYRCKSDGQGGQVCDSALALANGIIYAQETATGGSIAGKLTGGTGSYSGATGTIKLTARANGDANVTISYSTG